MLEVVKSTRERIHSYRGMTTTGPNYGLSIRETQIAASPTVLSVLPIIECATLLKPSVLVPSHTFRRVLPIAECATLLKASVSLKNRAIKACRQKI